MSRYEQTDLNFARTKTHNFLRFAEKMPQEGWTETREAINVGGTLYFCDNLDPDVRHNLKIMGFTPVQVTVEVKVVS